MTVEAEAEETVGPVELEVSVGGRPWPPPPPPPCDHGRWGADVVFAEIREGDDGTGPLVDRQVRVKLVCLGCGLPGRFRVETAGASRTEGDRGLVACFFPDGS